ncbi:50S ribosomal protein L31 [Arachidicoccus ginsenosidivorans]|uniref:50S ribosomal protein L31 n=1 Tax=Arachidicoccus ginsenosidivorans TaxID=496057 RepID=UPI0037445C95
MSNGVEFLSKSTAASSETTVFEGVEYPVIKLEISNTSHPFYTGKNVLVDTAGRIDKFNKRYGKKNKRNRKDQNLLGIIRRTAVYAIKHEQRFFFRIKVKSFRPMEI